MSLLRRATELHGIGRAGSLARNYEAWLEGRHGSEGATVLVLQKRHKIPIEANGRACAACAAPSRILWGASSDDALFCDHCLEHAGPVRTDDELGGSG